MRHILSFAKFENANPTSTISWNITKTSLSNWPTKFSKNFRTKN